jgi:hypothetical protein
MSNNNVKKTIQINPELFRVSGSKTRKNRASAKEIPKPIIPPSTLRNKLLNRIKEHKNNEIQEKTMKVNTEVLDKTTEVNTDNDNEFDTAINYLTDLARKQRKNAEKQKYDKKKKEDLHNRTIKNYGETPSMLDIQLDLPPELQEPTQLPSSNFTPIKGSQPELHLNYKVDEEVPYGCLKTGVKPSFKQWNQLTRKNYDDIDEIIRRNTDANKHIPSTTIAAATASATTSTSLESSIKKTSKPTVEPSTDLKTEKLKMLKKKLSDLENGVLNNNTEEVVEEVVETVIPKVIINNHNKNSNLEESNIKLNDLPKKISKKLTKRKFTLGKSKIHRKVGVLIKDNKTRKQIIEAQKELKRTSMPDIKKYLKNHGLIKIGTSAPNDVLRKMYESSILAGEITNTNKETLIHNFVNDNS